MKYYVKNHCLELYFPRAFLPCTKPWVSFLAPQTWVVVTHPYNIQEVEEQIFTVIHNYLASVPDQPWLYESYECPTPLMSLSQKRSCASRDAKSSQEVWDIGQDFVLKEDFPT